MALILGSRDSIYLVVCLVANEINISQNNSMDYMHRQLLDLKNKWRVMTYESLSFRFSENTNGCNEDTCVFSVLNFDLKDLICQQKTLPNNKTHIKTFQNTRLS